jgi:anthranilate phosphoribosyltransferase
VLRNTGTEKALIFHGNGLDELSLTGPNTVYEIRTGEIHSYEWTPETFGLPHCDLAELAGGTPDENAAATKAILRGHMSDARKNMVLLNAGAAIYAASNNDSMTLKDAIAVARNSLEDGRANVVLERLSA